MKRAQQLPLHLPLRPSYAAKDFIINPSNWEAVQWIERWPDWPMKMIAIHGEAGCGKTHLAHMWQERANAFFLTPADILKASPLDALRGKQPIIIDDADALFQKDDPCRGALEGWMFHFYNAVKEAGVDLLLCSLYPPTQWTITLPDLRSRLATILSIAVNSPDEDTLRSLLVKLALKKGMTLSPEVTDYILRRVERSFDSVRVIVETLDHYTLSTHRQPTLGLVREILHELEELTHHA